MSVATVLAVGMTLAAPLCAAELSGVVQDAAGAVPKAAVTLRENSTGKAIDLPTDASGAYTFTGVPAGVYDLVVAHAGFAMYRIQTIHLREDDRKNLDPIVLKIAACGDPLRQDALRELDQQSDRGNIVGRIVQKSNRAFPGVNVALFCPDHQVCATRTSDVEGRYHFLHLQPGDYQVKVQAKAYYEANLSLEVRAGFETINDAVGLSRCPHGNCKIPLCCCE